MCSRMMSRVGARVKFWHTRWLSYGIEESKNGGVKDCLIFLALNSWMRVYGPCIKSEGLFLSKQQVREYRSNCSKYCWGFGIGVELLMPARRLIWYRILKCRLTFCSFYRTIGSVKRILPLKAPNTMRWLAPRYKKLLHVPPHAARLHQWKFVMSRYQNFEICNRCTNITLSRIFQTIQL